MTQKDEKWRLELEESAQGTDLFKAPGLELQAAEAAEMAKESAGMDANSAKSSDLVEIARAKRQSLGVSMGHLEAVAAKPSGADGWLERTLSAVELLGRSLDDHIAVTEGGSGLLAEVLELAPQYAAEVDMIKAEHEGLLEALQKVDLTVRILLESGTSDPDSVRHRVMTLLSRLSLHRQRGADLVYDAYYIDIATAD